MHFKKGVPEDRKVMLRLELAFYEERVPLTSIERTELRRWVARGHSPYTNPMGYQSPFGGEMDFAAAIHAPRDTCMPGTVAEALKGDLSVIETENP